MCPLPMEKVKRHGIQETSCPNWQKLKESSGQKWNGIPIWQLRYRHGKWPAYIGVIPEFPGRLLRMMKSTAHEMHLNTWREEVDNFEDLGLNYSYEKRWILTIRETICSEKSNMLQGSVLKKIFTYYFQVQSWF